MNTYECYIEMESRVPVRVKANTPEEAQILLNEFCRDDHDFLFEEMNQYGYNYIHSCFEKIPAIRSALVISKIDDELKMERD